LAAETNSGELMILTCPMCTTRYLADGRAFVPSGRNVRCAKCGHVWFQMPVGPETEPEPEPVVEAPAAAAGTVEAMADAGFVRQKRSSLAANLATGAGWAVLVLLIFGLGAATVKYRDAIAELWPQTATLYAALGMPVNLRGLEIANVSYRNEVENGVLVLAVSGTLVNVTSHKLAVPRIWVGLSDDAKRELYHWSFDANATTLAPRSAADFSTRLTSPPREARHVEIRFAGAGE